MAKGKENKSLIRKLFGKHFQKDENRVRVFRFFERMGVHITPVHFYYPVPALSDLTDSVWTSPLCDIPANFNKQTCDDLFEMLHSYQHELYDIKQHKTEETAFFWDNTNFNVCDASSYYCMLRHFKPKRCIEIGAGYSTLIASKAIQKNGNSKLEVIEPYPLPFLKKVPCLSKLYVKKLQDVPLSFFEKLDSGDFLFVDSTHISQTGSDVNYIMLRILPHLKNGVFIHFHDIYLPYEMPKQLVKEKLFFWNEEYLLHAMLLGGNNYETILPVHYYCKNDHDKLKLIAGCVPEYYSGASYWIRKAIS